MRLINVENLELEEFVDDEIPPYAILSHRWRDGEILFKDMQSETKVTKAGYRKIKQCCDRAKSDKLQYLWVDTCCIDKSSNDELTESINSTYEWYQNAAVCYVYLFDVHDADLTDDSNFRNSAWFTRGWTLQELIAPSDVEFYNSSWLQLGTKAGLGELISEITNIDLVVLKGSDPKNFSVGKRMSWASERMTTRKEDMAYCLLGLFGVNMPCMYGEGERTFIRFQEEIMKYSDDQTLFAWSRTDGDLRGLLARSPADFRGCHNIVTSDTKLNEEPYSITNKGLSIELPMVAYAMKTYLVALDCNVENTPNSRLGIFLTLLSEKGQYARVSINGKDTHLFDSELIPCCEYRQVYVRQAICGSCPPSDRIYGFWLRKLPLRFSLNYPSISFGLLNVESWNEWFDDERILAIPTGSRGTAGVFSYGVDDNSIVSLKLGFDAMFNPVCNIEGTLWDRVSDLPKSGGLMDDEWLDTRQPSIFVGDRETGLDINLTEYKLSIADAVFDNRKVWAVDITVNSRIDHAYERCCVEKVSYFPCAPSDPSTRRNTPESSVDYSSDSEVSVTFNPERQLHKIEERLKHIEKRVTEYSLYRDNGI
ncbi:heterokaryon incompatibility protein-domain-containing protein [Aspergillus avenaceus]|uniref:Heterokaryon incompatibility protein-domain-containing protein n=1 Tax=Aspergillus avenaceus TaxID=36643 RepID=A0A5N6TSI4_ASPAV|nr:heterokaryon incompatibility protein-domain-containing protein [Aspergillus avenaceus]